MVQKLVIDPPLLNSSSPWATTPADLEALYRCPHTGAITTRTSLLKGFADNSSKHQHCFFDAGSSASSLGGINVKDGTTASTKGNSSLNTYGYSPIPLPDYLSYIEQMVDRIRAHPSTTDLKTSATSVDDENNDLTTVSSPLNPTRLPVPNLSSKPIIISVTGDPDAIIESYTKICETARRNEGLRLAMEINLSCPNIANRPPPAYDATGLAEYLDAVVVAKRKQSQHHCHHQQQQQKEQEQSVPVGIKLPPYTYMDQFRMVVQSLRNTNTNTKTTIGSSNGDGGEMVIDFITSTNTLGSSLVLVGNDANEIKAALSSESGTGIGGMAGAAIHSLSLGNVATLRRLLDEHEVTRDIFVIGVGGVADRAGYMRMKGVGADAVGVATALGREGVDVFEKIATPARAGI